MVVYWSCDLEDLKQGPRAINSGAIVTSVAQGVAGRVRLGEFETDFRPGDVRPPKLFPSFHSHKNEDDQDLPPPQIQ
jgi:hypothetical protein